MTTLAAVIGAISADIQDQQQELNRLDGIAGDGDLGLTVAAGAAALIALVPELEGLNAAAALRRCGTELARKAPSTSGTLLATACLRAAVAVGDPQVESESSTTQLAGAASAALTGIQQRGKANLGDKTMLDALAPAVAALESASATGLGVADALERAAVAARQGVDATAAMRARVGRAGWLADRSEGHPDAGAHLLALIFESAARHAAAG
jgi:dihydroxyacetone kinase